jgi:DNA recombination protein RmuC
LDQGFVILIAAAAAGLAAVVVLVALRLASAQAALTGRLSQMAEGQAAAQAQLAERLQAQERALTRGLEERLAELSRRVGETLEKSSLQAHSSMSELKERLVVIDAAQKNITELSSQVVGLQQILDNKQARGGFGETQLQNLVADVLPASAYSLQATLSNGMRADCLIRLPKPPGDIVVDSKFPLESYRALCNATDDLARKEASKRFGADIMAHVRAISEKYILPGETADSALMFLPSEAIYAELHAHFHDIVEKAHRVRVYTVSPTTLWAMLHTIRAVMKDVRMREQAGVIQQEVAKLMEDVGRLSDRAANLQRHFDQAVEDVRQIRTSTEKIAAKGERIREVEIADGGSESPALAPPAIRRAEGG